MYAELQCTVFDKGVNRLQLHKHVLVEVGAPGACMVIMNELKAVYMIKKGIQYLTIIR